MQRYIALEKIVELGSFTKAAEALGYTQSGISQMIASLEDELSIVLLARSRTGIKLTPEGERIYPSIQKSIYQYYAIQEKAKEIKGLDTGIIRIGTISSVTCHWLPDLIKDFQNKYPNVQFVLHQGDYSSIQEWIKIGVVDFGFLSPDAVSGLDTTIVKEGEMLAVLPKQHALSSAPRIKLHDIAHDAFLLLEEGHFSEPLNAFHEYSLEPKIKLRLHDDYAIMTMVEAGLGVSILAELVLRRTNYNIATIPVDPPIFRTLALAYKDKNSLPIASKYFIKHLLDHVEQLP